jgi:hypothetical protein
MFSSSRNWKYIQIENNILWRETNFVHQNIIRTLAILFDRIISLSTSSKAMIITAAPYRLINLAWWINCSSPSLTKLNLRLFSLHYFKSRLDNIPFELSIIIGTREISVQQQLNLGILSWHIRHQASPSILISMICATFYLLLQCLVPLRIFLP